MNKIDALLQQCPWLEDEEPEAMSLLRELAAVREALEKALPELEAMSLDPVNRTFFSVTLAHLRKTLNPDVLPKVSEKEKAR